MQKKIKLPVGVDSFEKLRKGEYYYVDKTMLIEQVLEEKSEVTLFTRPRRFGKTLNMSMLKSFFEIGTDPSLFAGLRITQNVELCERYMGKYPVISISLKSVEAAYYKEAVGELIDVVNREAFRFLFLMEDSKLSGLEKKKFEELFDRNMTAQTLNSSLLWLSMFLEKYYQQKVVVLIDEYDVPLAKAREHGYYDEMALLLRSLFGNVLKTNNSLAFAVLTGCLRIAKESIFTGLNNFKVYSILDTKYDEAFGFTDEEVQRMLQSYDLGDQFGAVKEWYDGYRFGNADVYCPWDVVNYCADHYHDPDSEFRNYWMNTSGNEVIEHFIESCNDHGMVAKRELEQLVNGNTIPKKIDETITYKELYSDIANMWSTLFMTGYLTQRSRLRNGCYELAIPNQEIRNIMVDRVQTLFEAKISQNEKLVKSFCNAVLKANGLRVERLLNECMGKTISLRDTFTRSVRENFYHGLLLGLLTNYDWEEIRSNQESGDGYSDIIIKAKKKLGIVIELKYSDSEENLDVHSRDALQQIDDKDYTQALRKEGCRPIIKYGIAFHHKTCKVLVERD